MRAGQYAVVDGEEFQARFHEKADHIDVTVWPGQRAPTGFTGRPMFHGTVMGQLPRARASRLFGVETWAPLHGRFPVLVLLVNPHDTAAIDLPLVGFTPVGEPIRDDVSRPVIPREVSGRPGELWYSGSAKLGDLSKVHETVRDTPVRVACDLEHRLCPSTQP